MPTYLDIHDVPGVSADAAAKAHALDVHFQSKHGVNYVKYWLNEKHGKMFCLCIAPNAEAADAVHHEAHGGTAGRILEVTPELAEAFMGAAEINKAGAVMLPGSVEHDPGTRTVMFTDMVGSTDMTERFGDQTSLDTVLLHDRIVRAALAATRGREVKHTGDGIMSVFYSAASAVRCAIAVQQSIAPHRDEHPGWQLRLRIGIASGEPLEHHEDLFGATVQLASRLCAHAEPEQILVSNAVAELCIGKMLPLKATGPVSLEGFDQPMQIHCVEIA